MLGTLNPNLKIFFRTPRLLELLLRVYIPVPQVSEALTHENAVHGVLLIRPKRAVRHLYILYIP